MLDLVIVGAGPYGISLAAHAQASGLTYKLLGKPMGFWRHKMPPEMFIRTQVDYIGLSDPHEQYTFAQYQKEKNIELTYPVSRTAWVDYAFWFAERNQVTFTEECVRHVNYKQGRYFVITDQETSLECKHLVIAIGLTHAEYIPNNLLHLKGKWLSHTNGYTDYQPFSGKSVAVVGGGQSGWEAAALLHQTGAKVDLIYRGSGYEPPVPQINRRQREIAPLFYSFPVEQQKEISKEFLKATVTEFLLPLVEGKANQHPYSEVKEANILYDEDQVSLVLSSGNTLKVDHVIAATGYRPNLYNLPFLTSLSGEIKKESNGFPIVNQWFESSMPGLYFVGPLSSHHHGPSYTQIAGVWHTSHALIPNLLKNA
ncbi:NAD(P)-binding domain-containing protein [Ammoniphilus sp. CFH 90114]|uniref:NAD(P)-binding domain-containing protein n=1 Tax=Ammoniphilus sp. CFH 90114 TaxID=2493665 RepID=UPI00100E55BA|nr:NAD(P)-binding domain-containing protein [Ammoniphilus sp. CFH 90114]RXT07215.1 hypothetical protein EIZ39_13820 [Ammoniphilus sp. CFH 90114]